MRCRYLAIDIETSGLDPRTCQVLEVAAVAETDWTTPVGQLPRLHLLVGHDEIRGDPVALAMNARVLAELAKPRHEREAETVDPDDLADRLRAFAREHLRGGSDAGGRVPLAGKNVGTFDLRFLERLPGWAFRGDIFDHRVIDAGLLWLDPRVDERVPGLPKALARAGLANGRPHHPLHDCYATVELIRRHYARHDAAPRGEGA